MSRKGQSITLSVSERDKAELENLALEFGMKWGDRPNISKLIEAIARHHLIIGKNHDWSESRLRAVHRAMLALADIGQNEQAQLIAQLLLERSELPIPLRTEVDNFLGNLPPAWRLEIDRYILREQPFQLSYQDARQHIWNFTVRYAKITPHEKRQYLDCWCEETEGNLDVEDLQHNWSLRLDRIQDAAVSPIVGEWRGSGLAEIDVEMHLFAGLAFAYQAKLEDKINEWLPDKAKVKRVVRRVSNTFWFIREVMQYAPDCVIVTPENVRSLIQNKIKTLYHNYGLDIFS
ncbi:MULTISPECIES: WYL domain-containing protein [Calothrix]|uniref:WYL domain-containing protein n=2 Tax=Calothrix TaxID=1186 RepID=A0ABR8AAD7_9CYAN|nr:MULTISPECIES: WYL domain-containing protein [Calothrix]MBD2196814.1 WYL domain-containing protein [Calothrix parietina FACHB-288]MBD2225366.1 WYL domain-containing protein [Calothrix anomala FACHB-343]